MIKLKVKLDWNEIASDIEKYKNNTEYLTSILSVTDYNKTFVDSMTEDTQSYRIFGYTEHNTKIWKSTSKEPKLDFYWEDELCKQLPLDNAIATLTRQDPGQCLPWHQDKFHYLRKLYPNDTRPIVRALVFMQDWKVGHIVQVENSIAQWQQGDVWIWKPGTMHLSANVGLEPKWTCNVTGFVNPHQLLNLIS